MAAALGAAAAAVLLRAAALVGAGANGVAVEKQVDTQSEEFVDILRYIPVLPPKFPPPAEADYLSEDGLVSKETGTEDCWASSYTWEACCRAYEANVRGYRQCWSKDFDYERCCIPEFERRTMNVNRLTDEGDLRRAAHAGYDLLINYAQPSENRVVNALAFGIFERSRMKYQQYLDRLPANLSYFEVLFHGAGLDCEPREGGNVLDDLYRCCPWIQGVIPCDMVFEAIAQALARKMRKQPEGEDIYYSEMSEHWAFHHFTPSVFFLEGMDEQEETLEAAFALDPGISKALGQAGDPRLGVMYSEHHDSYQSNKFFVGIRHLTEVLHMVRKLEKARPIHFFEVGAGFGMLPYLLGHARDRLLDFVDVQSYTIIDRPSALDLQRWYLNHSLGSRVNIRRWPAAGEEARDEKALKTGDTPDHKPPHELWPPDGLAPSDPLRVELVPREERDLFIHAYSDAHAKKSGGPADGDSLRPLRILVAVNSLHEFGYPEFYWYYNTFFAGPEWLAAADYILYVSNIEWHGNEKKVDMVTKLPGLEVVMHRKNHITEWRLLRRTGSRAA